MRFDWVWEVTGGHRALGMFIWRKGVPWVRKPRTTDSWETLVTGKC